MAIQTLNITKSGNGSGTVTSDLGIPPVDCGDTCSVNQTSGTNVTLTATPDPGSRFVRWTGDVNSTSNPVTYLQELNPTNINAEFQRSGGAKIGGWPFIKVHSSKFITMPSTYRFRGRTYYFYAIQGDYYVFSKNNLANTNQMRNLVGLGGSTIGDK